MTTPTPSLIQEIGSKFGTPAYVYSEDELIERYTTLRRNLHEAIDLFYSVKPNPNVAIARNLVQQGAGCEVCSMHELKVALRAGARPQDIIFVGPGKTDAEIGACLGHGIYAIVVESLNEISRIGQIRNALGTSDPARVMLRVNPDFAGSGSGLSMSGKPRQFGIDQDQLTTEVLQGIDSRTDLTLVGVHVYMGTRYLSTEAIEQNTRNIVNLYLSITDAIGRDLEALDVGGGFGVPYFSGETELDVGDLCERISSVIDSSGVRRHTSRLIIELGRYLVASCGWYVTRVIDTKVSRGIDFAVADGGTNHHMAAVGIGSPVHRNFPAAAIRDGMLHDGSSPTTVTGPLCTPNDTLLKNAELGPLQPGDLVVLAQSGAYGASASPVNFLGHGAPVEVMIRPNGDFDVIRKRVTADELLEQQND